jgi:hypothetical protein
MAFSADELRVLRRALAIALHPVPLADEEVQDCLRLADSVDEAVREAGRLRVFLHADLARYRAALPGAAVGYLELLQDALAAGYDPRPEDLAALRTLRARPAGAAVLRRCQTLAEQSVRARLAAHSLAAHSPAAHSLAEPPSVSVPAPARAPDRARAPDHARAADHAGATVPARARLLALPGGLAANEPKPQPRPPTPGERPVPKPSEVFPPRRRPVPPPEHLAAG